MSLVNHVEALLQNINSFWVNLQVNNQSFLRDKIFVIISLVINLK